MSITKDFYEPLLKTNGFIKTDDPNQFNDMGTCWSLSSELGEGIYWVYEQDQMYDIKIHDFYFHKDMIMELKMPECMSITYYESISGEELLPYKRLTANCVKSFIGGSQPFKAVIHKKIPIKCIGIEILPKYYEDYLKANYPDVYINPYDAFKCIDETEAFPEMVHLLTQIKNYRGSGISAKLFFDAKVAEAVSLVVKRQLNKSKNSQIKVSEKDREFIQSVTCYINDHFAFDIRQEQLARIACMGTTKLKKTFKSIHGCTITEYIQHKRISHSEHLLGYTNLSIQQVSETVGYTSGSRFSALFKKYIGLLPSEYRKILQNKQ